jgi:hypothetical protein
MAQFATSYQTVGHSAARIEVMRLWCVRVTSLGAALLASNG